MAGAVMEELCKSWCQEQGLDEECVNTLLQLDEATISTVMEGFRPKPGTLNPSGLFMGYVRSIQRAQAGGKAGMPGKGGKGAAFEAQPVAQEDVQQFAAQWGLDEECVSVLLEQRPQVIADVVSGFRPRPDTRDIRSLFFGYVKSVASGGKGGKANTFAGGVAPVQNLQGQVWFAQQLGGLGGFDQTSWLPQQPQYAALTQAIGGAGVFAPKGKAAMPKGGTVRSVPYSRPVGAAGKGPASNLAPVTPEDLWNFVATWQLDQSSTDFLMSQAPEVQREALDNFRPKPGTSNVSGLFMGYLNSLVRAVRSGKGIR
eukprot:CAMPEP_0181444026 /NCGR_PEP_ID=MMETSP1110-20121109/24854_1 /TAXON_ID=174948 /ORGANISM="Symbiodinium sp., Strain CCMP421" /LENGTH=313 /DNA_ID=CAMNT_0023568015 /DNA_START=36 /DNA_END=977 /DNA_ORIENTATION=+